MKFRVTGKDGTATVSAILNGNLYVAEGSHPNFLKIVDALENNSLYDFSDTYIVSLFDYAREFVKQFENISERVSFANGNFYFDGDLVDNILTNQAFAYMRSGRDDWQSLVKFMEKLYDNPNAHSREQLYNWLRNREFVVTPEGNFLAYKSVQTSDLENFDYISISAGNAVVDGTVHNGNIPQNVNSVVTMPRSDISSTPEVGCGRGLHAGTYDYANTFSGNTILMVEINPRDVVSVPSDCDSQKIRCCRYKVVSAEAKEVAVDLGYGYDNKGNPYDSLFEDDEACDYCREYIDECYCHDEDDDEQA
jgi:hypothetical protein